MLLTCDTFDEAMEHINDYGNDSCIVKVVEDDYELVYSLLTGNVIIASRVDVDDMRDSVVFGSKIKAKHAKLRRIFSFGSKISIE